MASATRPSPYEVLGIAPGASEAAVKQAYRQQAQRHHPDKHPNDPQAQERFQAIQAAYAELARPSPASAIPSRPFEDLFAQFFHATAVRRVEIVLGLEDVLTPSTQAVTLPDGPAQVHLPAGLDHGDRVPIFRQGQRLAGWEAVVRMRPHPQFQRQGADLWHEVTLSYAQVVLGGQMELDVLGRRLQVTLPPGLMPGQRVVLAGQGLPYPHEGQGDLVVGIQLEIPRHLTAAQRKAVEALDKKLHPPAKVK